MLGRIAPVQGGLRAVRQRVLRAFAETGQPPTVAGLDEAARPYGTTGAEVMSQLHAADFVRLDQHGELSAAYPFSPTPTLHRVQISDDPQVYAMCAIDALGIAAMLGRDVRISCLDPCDGRPVTVEVTAAGQARWAPVTAVVFAGQQEACQPCTPTTAPPSTVPPTGASRGAAELCCGSVNFFGDQQGALTWATAHPQVSGHLLDQQAALKMGVAIFGPLLAEPMSEPDPPHDLPTVIGLSARAGRRPLAHHPHRSQEVRLS